MKIAVIGQGYVGLTVAVGAAAVEHNVVGFDINEKLISDLSQGNSYVPGIIKKDLVNLVQLKKYIPTVDAKLIDGSEIIIIAVPTPLNDQRDPDLKFIESAVEIIAQNMSSPALVINESTSYPGTLRGVIKPLLDKSSKQKFLFAASPERVDPGSKNWTIKNTPRIISGLTKEATEKAIKFYSTFCESITEVSTPEVAEASKVFENTFRQINIALVNEFSEISNKLGFSANEAIKAAATKPFGFMPFYPSIGVGGHCIPIDPTYLSYIASQKGITAQFINLANQTNLLMPVKVAKRIQKYLDGNIEGKRIQIAGIAYKTDVPDMRESPTIKLISELENLGAKVFWCDPLVKVFEDSKSQSLDINIDLGLIINPHKEIDLSIWKRAGTNVLDLSSNPEDFGWPKFL